MVTDSASLISEVCENSSALRPKRVPVLTTRNKGTNILFKLCFFSFSCHVELYLSGFIQINSIFFETDFVYETLLFFYF